LQGSQQVATKLHFSIEDFAKACVFFAVPASDAVTGQSMSVDGGLTMP
jgi:enoyl-[acyl-carrier-protein] reductase (NADH)